MRGFNDNKELWLIQANENTQLYLEKTTPKKLTDEESDLVCTVLASANYIPTNGWEEEQWLVRVIL